MELKQLQTFLVLAEELNFTRTAERLNYAQSSVTTQIQSLEQEFGVQLFERLGKRIYLTEAGHRLLGYAKDMLRIADEARIFVPGQSEPSGTLTIGAVESLCTYRLAPVLMAFRIRYPQVELVFRTGICADLRKEVAQGNLDLAFTLEEECHDESLVVSVLMHETMLVLACPTHPLVVKDHISAIDLQGETILVTEPGCSYRKLFQKALSDSKVHNSKIEFASVEAIKQCVIAGLGVTLLPEMAVKEEIERGALRPLAWDGPIFPVVTQMSWHKDKWMSPALHAFIQLAKESLWCETI